MGSSRDGNILASGSTEENRVIAVPLLDHGAGLDIAHGVLKHELDCSQFKVDGALRLK